MVTEDQVKLIQAPNDEDDVVMHLRNVWKFMNGIRNVQKTFLSADTLEVILYCRKTKKSHSLIYAKFYVRFVFFFQVLSQCCESISVFNKLKLLHIKSNKERGLIVLICQVFNRFIDVFENKEKAHLKMSDKKPRRF